MQALVADTEKSLLVQVDSTFCKVHQYAAGARKKHGDQAIGVSRGGNTTKMQGVSVCIPDKTNSLIKYDFDKELYKVRNEVERFFLRINNRRHIAIRYAKLAVCFLNFVILSALLIQL